ncbi:hypothetical protein [Aliterella atlantica]|uniref:hypothetical protein n=1 Tax=Aliterella atlantica TaxID=1827278 RepID=UPI0006964876|nr:hypothetical protein [Aliterella atlantica]
MIDNLVVTESSLLGASALIAVEASQIDILEQLTPEEQRDRQRLELGVEQAFYQAGKALAQLRERRLYRTTHKTFEAYCQDRFGFTRRHSDYLINGAKVVENLLSIRTISPPNYAQGNLRTIPAQILPTKLEQVKPLTSLEPDQWRLAWNKAVEKAHGKVPSGQIVRAVVEQLQAKPLVLAQDYCQVGDVFILTRLQGKDSQYNGCWAIALKPTNSTVIVDVHDATLTVKPNNLNKIDSSDVQQNLPQILQRIRRLRQVEQIDRAADNILKALGKHTELTVVEQDLLSWLERYYHVDAQERTTWQEY